MFEVTDLTKDNVIAIKAHGTIESKDYEKLIPLIEKLEREDKPIRLFVEIGDIEGITANAVLKDVATYFKHAKHIEKVAVVGENDLFEKTWSKVADPFIKAEIQYFPKGEQVIAEKWINQ